MPPTFIANRVPYGAHVIVLFILIFSAFILNLLIVFSSPFVASINFLELPSPSGATTFGCFGWCAPGFCLDNTVAYEYGTQVNKALTGGMMLWVVSIIFVFFTLLSILPLLFVHESRALRFVGNQSFFVYSADLAVLITSMAWLFSIYGWSIAHRAFEVAGTDVNLGPAMWMGLATALAMILMYLFGWPKDAWDGYATRAAGGGGRGLPAPPGNGYYHYKRTTREVVPRV